MNTSLGKDALIVEEGPMTGSRVKRVKEAVGLFVQVAKDETSILANK